MCGCICMYIDENEGFEDHSVQEEMVITWQVKMGEIKLYEQYDFNYVNIYT